MIDQSSGKQVYDFLLSLDLKVERLYEHIFRVQLHKDELEIYIYPGDYIAIYHNQTVQAPICITDIFDFQDWLINYVHE